MKWFDRWFVKKSKWAWENKHLAHDNGSKNMLANTVSARLPDMPAKSAGAGISASGMQFTVYRANGGIVLEFSDYDLTTDRRNTELYVIPEGENWGDEIAKCITMQALRRG